MGNVCSICKKTTEDRLPKPNKTDGNCLQRGISITHVNGIITVLHEPREEHTDEIKLTIRSFGDDNWIVQCEPNSTGQTQQENGIESERKKIFQCGYRNSSRSRAVPAGNFIDCRNVPLRNSMHDVVMLSSCYQSICQIRWSNKSGTGFRVGSKYIMTALHVVRDIIRTVGPRNEVRRNDRELSVFLAHRNVYCQFNYLVENNFEDVRMFYFKPVVHFADEETDTAVLELHADVRTIPPAFCQFGCSEFPGKFTLIGHEGSAMEYNTVDMIIDKENQTTVGDIRWIKQYNSRKTDRNFEFEPYSTLTNRNRILFHCKFSKGASGSPGVVVLKDGNVIVVTMLLCGFPNWYYNESVDGRLRSEWPKEYCIEQGTDMASVWRSMIIKNPHLHEDIFGRDLDEPALF